MNIKKETSFETVIFWEGGPSPLYRFAVNQELISFYMQAGTVGKWIVDNYNFFMKKEII